MSVKIDYHLSDALGWKESPARTASVRESDLRYDLYLGSFTLRIGDCDFGAKWNWVPILDLVAVLSLVVGDLASSSAEDLDFTESDELVNFKRTGDQVSVSATYVKCVAVCSFAELTNAVVAFAHRVLADIRASDADAEVVASEPFQALEDLIYSHTPPASSH